MRMSKYDPTHTPSYESIKTFWLQELHLFLYVYLDKFYALVRDKDETFGQFSTRLMSLFEYYVESRNVGHSYDKLVDLMVYDKIKSSFSPSLARHVLSLEAAHKDFLAVKVIWEG